MRRRGLGKRASGPGAGGPATSGVAPGKRTKAQSLAERKRGRGAGAGAATLAPGKRTLTQSAPQRKRGPKGSPAAEPPNAAQDAAAAGVAGAASVYPHKEQIEASFGAPLGATAHTDTAAREATGALAAEAFTTGEHVAFRSPTPDLHTAAHEATHVVQQRAGVQRKTELGGESGDVLERQADSIAERVVRGESVAPEISALAGSGPSREAGSPSAVSRSPGRAATIQRRWLAGGGDGRVIEQGNRYEDQQDAWDKLVAWVKGEEIVYAEWAGGEYANTRQVPDDRAALGFFHELTPDRRRDVFLNREGVLSKIFEEFDEEDALTVMNLCDFPLSWKIRHWFGDVAGMVLPGQGKDVLRRIISNAPLGQRLDALRNADSVGVLRHVFGDEHPENIFGDEIRDALYPDISAAIDLAMRHRRLARWLASSEKLDAEERWAFIAENPAANIATLKGQPAAGGGDDAWTALIAAGPRGQALSPTMRENIDIAALDPAVDADDRAQLFLVRWNAPLTDPGAPFDRVEVVWQNLQALPLGVLSSDVVTEVELRLNSSAGAYTDLPQASNFGRFWVGTDASLAHVGHTTRHEVGHAADTKLGGFANFASRPPIAWKSWMTSEAWVRAIADDMDGTSSRHDRVGFTRLLSAALNGDAFWSLLLSSPGVSSLFGIDDDAQNAWDDAADAYNNGQGLQAALEILRDAGKHTADPATVAQMIDDAADEDYPNNEPGYVGGRYYVAKYSEYYSYHESGGNDAWSTPTLSDWTMCSPYEFYADVFAAYFSTDEDRGDNVPSWAADYFKDLEEMYGGDATTDADNRRATAISNLLAPRKT